MNEQVNFAIDLVTEKMKDSIGHLELELSKIRAGRANTSILDCILVDYYGTPTPIQNMASLTTPDIQVDSKQENGRQPVSIKLLPWLPLSKDENIPVVADWVISIVEPQDKLMEMYKKALKTYENRKSKNNSSSGSKEDSESDRGSSE